MRKCVLHSVVIIGIVIVAIQGKLQAQNWQQNNLVQFITHWGEKGSGSGQFQNPNSISVDPSGFLYIADTQNNRIQRFDSNGNFLSEKGGFGWAPEEFDRPVAVSSQNGLDVFIADYNNHRIVRYDKDLHYLASFLSNEQWNENLQFGYPMGVDLSVHGELFCLDTENNRILKLDVLGNPQISFGDFDAGEGRLIEPQRLIVTRSGKVFVSDTGPGRIVVFDIHGNFLITFGEDVLKKPAGMASVNPGVILICDSGAKTVFAFREEGDPLGILQSALFTDEEFEEPIDAAFWNDRVYILDRKKAVIFVFQWIYKGGKISE
jgi:DNA-binding beta-propeller fold protein YncE